MALLKYKHHCEICALRNNEVIGFFSNPSTDNETAFSTGSSLWIPAVGERAFRRLEWDWSHFRAYRCRDTLPFGAATRSSPCEKQRLRVADSVRQRATREVQEFSPSSPRKSIRSFESEWTFSVNKVTVWEIFILQTQKSSKFKLLLETCLRIDFYFERRNNKNSNPLKITLNMLGKEKWRM